LFKKAENIREMKMSKIHYIIMLDGSGSMKHDLISKNKKIKMPVNKY
jgi:hypothetical protein